MCEIDRHTNRLTEGDVRSFVVCGVLRREECETCSCFVVSRADTPKSCVVPVVVSLEIDVVVVGFWSEGCVFVDGRTVDLETCTIEVSKVDTSSLKIDVDLGSWEYRLPLEFREIDGT